jgi:hypothetical protein
MAVVKVNADKMVTAVVKLLPGKNDIQKGLQALGAAARAEWISQASDELRSTSRAYIQGIGEAVVGENSVSITLTGRLPLMVEEGWPQTDLRTTLLRSPKAKTSKAGHKYMSIPFRHGTPGTSGRNVGRAMPRPIHNVAKHLGATHSPARRLGLQGPRQPALHAGMKMSRKAKTILESKEKKWHSSSIYTGMIRKVAEYRNPDTGETSMQSSYQTFRTISENVKVDPNHWLHPGIKARRIIPRVQRTVRTIASKVFADAIK